MPSIGVAHAKIALDSNNNKKAKKSKEKVLFISVHDDFHILSSLFVLLSTLKQREKSFTEKAIF